jgi:hypothetical protein
MAGCMAVVELDRMAVAHTVVVVGPAAAVAADHKPEVHSSGGNSVVPGEPEDAVEGHEAGHVQDAIVDA